MSDCSPLYVNGHRYELGDCAAYPPTTTLLTFLRREGWTGTKLGCGEGGCGACTVMVTSFDAKSSKIRHESVNACLRLLYSCVGCMITTVEGIGNRKKGLHVVQQRMVDMHGSQCGFCTPGIVMSLYTMLRNFECPHPDLLEEYLGGNLCRCTGYRPILDAAKSLCGERTGCCGGGSQGAGCPCKDEESGGDSENRIPMYSADAEPIFPPELKARAQQLFHLRSGDAVCGEASTSLGEDPSQFKDKSQEPSTWMSPTTLVELLDAKETYPAARIVVGNTEVGVEVKFKNVAVERAIFAGQVRELLQMSVDADGGTLNIGASVSLSDIESFLKNLRDNEESPLLPHQQDGLSSILEQLRWFASKQIRNVACLGGNIVTASPISDLNPLWMAMDCTFVLLSKARGERRVSARTFFVGYRSVGMEKDEVLVRIEIPLCEELEYVESYKQAKRKEDDIAIVNSGMRLAFTECEDGFYVQSAGMAFGGVAAVPLLARGLEELLVGRRWDIDLLIKGSAQVLTDVQIDPAAPPGMVEYRRALVVSFFQKFFHTVSLKLQQVNPMKIVVSEMAASASHRFERPISSGIQSFPDLPEDSIVGKPIPHLAAAMQVSGEAQYVDDIPTQSGEVHGALVLTSIPRGRLVSVDPSEALAMEGVVDFFSYKDIPGANGLDAPEPWDDWVFVQDEITAVAQVIGILVAESPEVAKLAALRVKVVQEEAEPIMCIKDAIKVKSYNSPILLLQRGNVDDALASADHVLEGEISVGGQEHFYLEPHATLVLPTEDDEYTVFTTSQCLSKTADCIAQVLGIPNNRVATVNKRLGGGFGGKYHRNLGFSSAAAVASCHLRRPVRLVIDRDVDMQTTGQRHPFLGRYKVGVSSDGRIQAMDLAFFNNGGFAEDDSVAVMERAVLHSDNCYYIENFRVEGVTCKTNIPSNTAFRGFGGPQGVLITEEIMDHVATFLGIPHVQLRTSHMYEDGQFTHYGQLVENSNIRNMWNGLLESCNYLERLEEVHRFNTENCFRKRGIALTPSKYGIAFTERFMNQGGALVMIYKDGTVSITHGGMEMGQGLHTKVCQVAAENLGIPIDLVHVSGTASDRIPNSIKTAASMGSDLYCMAVYKACQKLIKRLQPVREALEAELSPGESLEWKALTKRAFTERINLNAQGFYAVPNIGMDWESGQGSPFSYFTNGAACTEVEIDTLTGEMVILRSDLIMDVGRSLNQAIDIGQIEGAFVQGLGLFTMEELVFGDSQHPWMRKGHLFTKGPGTYKIPSFSDIPIDMRVTLQHNAHNPLAVHSSRAIGEPPTQLCVSVFFAIKEAIRAYRVQNGFSAVFTMDSPATPERIRMACADSITAMVCGSTDTAATIRPKGSF